MWYLIVSIPDPCCLSCFYKLSYNGIKENALGGIDSFLSGRLQKVVIESKSSSSALVLLGVLQGSVLGTERFLIYINDLRETSLIALYDSLQMILLCTWLQIASNSMKISTI